MERLRGQNCPKPKTTLKKHLLQVFLASLYYDGSATIRYMEMRGITKDILIELVKLKKKFKTKFEIKSFIVGVGQLIVATEAPDSLTDQATVARLIKECLELLRKVQKKEETLASKKSNLNKEDESDYDDEYSSEDDLDDSSDDEEDGEI